MTPQEAADLRALFVHYLTADSATKDRRRRAFNQAIFNAKGGWAIWSSTDLEMVMSKFDKAIATYRLTPSDATVLVEDQERPLIWIEKP